MQQSSTQGVRIAAKSGQSSSAKRGGNRKQQQQQRKSSKWSRPAKGAKDEGAAERQEILEKLEKVP